MKKYLAVIALLSLVSVFITPSISAQVATTAQAKTRTAATRSDHKLLISPDIVISQVYGGGGNAGSTYTNDYIELFNRSASSVSVAGWSVQYASAAGTTWAVTNISGTIQPGGYYLVQEGPGAGGTTGLPTPDATGIIAMSATAGKVALSTSTTPFTGSTPVGAKDLIGYGSTASSFEGTSPAPAPSNTVGDLRAAGGCVDTDQNGSDFATGSPNPRNSSTSPNGCSSTTDPTGTGSATPNNPNPGDVVLLKVTVAPGTNPPSTGISVVANLSSIGGGTAQSLFDDGTNGDVTPGDNIFSLSTNVGAATTGGIKTINFTVADTQDRSSDGSFKLTVQGTSNPSGNGSATPNAVPPGGSTVFTVNVVPGTLPTSTGIAVSADLSAIGGSPTQAFTDSGNNTTFTFSGVVGGATSFGLKNLPFTITDAQSRTGTGTIQLTVQNPSDPSHTPAEHEVLGNPTGAGATNNNDWLLERNQYVLSYNCGKGIPNWVGWHIDSSWTGSAARQDDYRPDSIPPLPTGCYVVQNTDYSGSGFDRGHNVPSADRTSSIPDNSATFLMTNFIPQAPNNNQGVWQNMESYIRTQITAGNEVYTWMGNSGQGGTGSNGGVTMTVASGHVVVPAYVWRVVMVLPVGTNDLSRIDTNTRVFAVLTPNVQNSAGLNGNWMTYICPVSKIEQLTGMNFFPNVPASTASVLKQKVDPILAAQTIPSGSVTNLTIGYPETYMTGDVTVTGTLALGPETLNTSNAAGTSNFTVTLAPGASVTRTNGGMVTGTLSKQYSSSSDSFTYPVGTLNGYSPITANLTALGTNPSSLSVKAVQNVEPNANPQNTALKRYWTLTEAGDLTANLVFNYLDSDVPSGTTESSLRLNKWEGSYIQVPAAIDTSANTVTTSSPVSAFSNWTLLPMLTAAEVSVSGRVLTAEGRGVTNALVVFTDLSGQTRTAVTNRTGRYTFYDVPVGSSFVANVKSRRFVFTPRIVQVFDNLTDEDFSAQDTR